MARRKRKERIEARKKADLRKFFVVMAFATVIILVVLFLVYRASQ